MYITNIIHTSQLLVWNRLLQLKLQKTLQMFLFLWYSGSLTLQTYESIYYINNLHSYWWRYVIFSIIAGAYCGILNFAILRKKIHVKQCQPSRYCSLKITKQIAEVSLLVTKICHHPIFSSHYVPLAGWLFVNLTNLNRSFAWDFPGLLAGTYIYHNKS